MNTPRFIFTPALLLAVLALVLTGAGWLYQHEQEVQLRAELGSRMADFQSAIKQSQLTAQNAEGVAQSLASRVAALESRQAETRTQQLALQTLYQDMLRDRQEWKLAEIEHMLISANDQLQLTGNVRGAIIALEIADQRLTRQDNPRYLPLRAAVNQDLDALRGVAQPDIAALSLQFSQLVQAVSGWPLVSGASRTEPPRPGKPSTGLGQTLLADLRQLVQIRRLGPQEPALLTPEQGQYLRDNLRLHLLSARLALLARDQTDYRQDIHAALPLVQRYFNGQDSRVQAGLQTLQRLARLNVAPPVPALSATLTALQSLGQARP